MGQDRSEIHGRVRGQSEMCSFGSIPGTVLYGITSKHSKECANGHRTRMDGANPIHYIASQSIEHSTRIHNTMFITHTPHHHVPDILSRPTHDFAPKCGHTTPRVDAHARPPNWIHPGTRVSSLGRTESE